MDWKTIEQQAEDAAKGIGAEVEAGAKSIFARLTSAISSFFGLVSPKWRQFAAEWKVWSWVKRITFLIVAIPLTWIGVHYGTSIGRLINGNFDAARAYAKGDVVSRSDLGGKASAGDVQRLQDNIGTLTDTVNRLIATMERVDGAADELQTRIQALEARPVAAEPQKKSATRSRPPAVTGSVPSKKSSGFVWPF